MTWVDNGRLSTGKRKTKLIGYEVIMKKEI